MAIYRYHALSNDYLVSEWSLLSGRDPAEAARAICDRHRGVGGDGLLLWDRESARPFRLKIFNPDGSVAEISGNGLRIFARHLFDQGLVEKELFLVLTDAGEARCQVESMQVVGADLGCPIFDFEFLPCIAEGSAPLRLDVADREISVFPVSMGNPHAVCIADQWSSEDVQQIGPILERHPWFPNRTNVQFVQIVDNSHLRLQIWERGVGVTHASGTSAAAAVAIGWNLGLMSSPVEVSMRGGTLNVTRTQEGGVWISGPVASIGSTKLSPEFWEEHERSSPGFDDTHK
jgi:diaminopimelate epimerase